MRATEEEEDSDRVYDVVLGLRGRDIRVADHGYVLATSRVFSHRHLATTTTTILLLLPLLLSAELAQPNCACATESLLAALV